MGRNVAGASGQIALGTGDLIAALPGKIGVGVGDAVKNLGPALTGLLVAILGITAALVVFGAIAAFKIF